MLHVEMVMRESMVSFNTYYTQDIVKIGSNTSGGTLPHRIIKKTKLMKSSFYEK